MVNILFVCSGDSCRSPMMVSVFMHMLKKTGYFDSVSATSAGISVSGEIKSVNELANFALNEYKIPTIKHIPTQLTLEILDKSDFVITATSEIKSIIQKGCNFKNVKSFADFVNEELVDPYGGGRGAYLKTAEVLVKYMKTIIEKLIEMGVIK